MSALPNRVTPPPSVALQAAQPETRTVAVLLIAAPASGQGKTTFVAALTRYYTRSHLKVRVFKCGPDFLDPMWHALASDAAVHPLDLWMTGIADVRARLWQAAHDCDVILIEGVMGLYDGQPSAADLARMLGVAVVGLIAAGSMATTFGALAYGLQHYQTPTQGALPWAGVIANQVASARHAELLRLALHEPQSWLGAIPKDPRFHLPSRHLGLQMASEMPDALAQLDAMADVVQAAITETAIDSAHVKQWRVVLTAPSAQPVLQPMLQGRTIAIARDAAFCFIYAGNVTLLQQLGATVRYFSPLHDTALPACDALWLPGGYPELHLQTLQNNTQMRDSIAAHIAADRPIWAECGGMMCLFETITLAQGDSHTLWGLWPGTVQLHTRRKGLGMHQLDIPAPVDMHAPRADGETLTLRGHTFHYSSVNTRVPVIGRSQRAHQRSSNAAEGEALYQLGPVRASYFHAWMPSQAQAAARLFLPQPLRRVQTACVQSADLDGCSPSINHG